MVIADVRNTERHHTHAHTQTPTQYLRAVLLLLHKLYRLLGARHTRLDLGARHAHGLVHALCDHRCGRCGRRLCRARAYLVARALRPLAMRVHLCGHVGGDRVDGCRGVRGRLRGRRG